MGGGTQGLQSTPVALNDQGKNTSLYNGNIATWTSLNKEVNYTTMGGQRVYQAWTQQFEYDQLNRIKSGKSLGSDAYKNTYAYDANGNITSLNRYNESGVQFDQLSYNYENKKAGYLANTNKLRSVSDLPSMTGVHTSDIDNQVTDNYEYDEIGNLNKDVQEQIKNIEWTVYGKIKSVTREAGSPKSNLSFEYDASGNRTVKIVTDKDGNVTKTFYIRDAQGNVMSTYEVPTAGSLTLDEQYIYGSSRLGVLRNEVRSYELTDHLGNVRSVIGELKDANNQVEVISATDYYPFGMIAKSFNSQNYRYGFNGMEKDNESGFYTTEFRDLDVRTGRWISVDPKQEYQMWQSPYCSMNNNPIILNDPNGDIAPAVWAAIVYALETGAETGIDIALGVTLTYLTGLPYTGWDVAADYFANLIPGWGEAKKIKKVAQVSEAITKMAVKLNKIPGVDKLLKEVGNGLEKFKETGDIKVIEKLKGKLYELKLVNSLDNVIGAGSNAREIASFSGLTKAAGELLNKSFGDVTFDVVQKTEKGVLNLLEAKTTASVKGATTLFGKTGIDSDDAKDIVKKLDFFSNFTKQGGKGTLEFNFSEEVTQEFRDNILQFAKNRGIDINLVKVVGGN